MEYIAYSKAKMAATLLVTADNETEAERLVKSYAGRRTKLMVIPADCDLAAQLDHHDNYEPWPWNPSLRIGVGKASV